MGCDVPKSRTGLTGNVSGTGPVWGPWGGRKVVFISSMYGGSPGRGQESEVNKG